jgi:amino acid permease
MVLRSRGDITDTPYSIDEQLIFNEPMPENSTLFDSFQLLLNTAIGSGTLMVPYCYTSGVGLSLLTSLLFATIGYFTLNFMAESGYFAHKYDYKGLFEHTFGRDKLWIVNVMILCVQFGASMIYCHWNGRLVPKLLGTDGRSDILGSTSFWTIIICVCCSLPLVCLKSIHFLERLAVVSTFAILLLIAHAGYFMFVHISKDGFDPQHQLKFFDFNAAAITGLSVNSMAYNCHLNLFTAIEHMKKPTVGRARKLTSLTVCTSYILYNIFGLFTYFDLFKTIGRGSSLEYYDNGHIFTKITLGGIIFMLILSVPLVIWAARKSVNSMIFKDTEPTTLRWITIGTIIAIGSAGLAASSDNVILFFDVVGGFFTPTIIFFMPALFYIKNQRNEPKWKIAVAYAIAAFTIIAVIVCVSQAVEEVIDTFKGKK